MSKNNHRPRIMVCEDEPFIALNLIAIIEDCGCEAVGPFATGKEALATFRRQRIDAALLDVDLADGASTPVARALREKDTPLLVISGLQLTKPPPEFAGLQWLGKPLDENKLREFCTAMVANAQPGAAISPHVREPAPSLAG